MLAASALVPAAPGRAQVTESKAGELRAEIARTGSLRVIITVATNAQAVEPSAAVTSSQQQLLRALQGTKHQVVFVFPSTPLVALIVGPDALDVLLSNSLVTSIMVDQPRTPSTAAP